MFNLRICKSHEREIIENLCQFYYYDLDINSNRIRFNLTLSDPISTNYIHCMIID